jgi:2-dehydro-3-deoxygluconokinase
VSQVDLLTLGEAMVSLRVDGPVAEGSALTAHVAGAESNVAIGLARLGHQVRWAGRLGTDPFGDVVIGRLRAEGIDVAHVVRDPARPTGLMVVERRTADLARVEYRRDRSAASALTVADLEAAVSAGARVVHLTGITPALSASARDSVLWAADAARRAGSLVSLDVNHRSRLWPRDQARETLHELAGSVDVVIASDDELDLLVDDGCAESAAVTSLLDRGVTHVGVKRGAKGASLWVDGLRYDTAAVPVTCVDTLGAGDAFSAGLLSGLLDGLRPEECLRRAAVLGAFAVSTHGDWEGLPRREELHLLDGLVPGSALR